jgi:hypothetical protein
MEMLGERGECGRPLQCFVSYCLRADCVQSRTGGNAALAQEADHGLAALLQYLGGIHCG